MLFLTLVTLVALVILVTLRLLDAHTLTLTLTLAMNAKYNMTLQHDFSESVLLVY